MGKLMHRLTHGMWMRGLAAVVSVALLFSLMPSIAFGEGAGTSSVQREADAQTVDGRPAEDADAAASAGAPGASQAIASADSDSESPNSSRVAGTDELAVGTDGLATGEAGRSADGLSAALESLAGDGSQLEVSDDTAAVACAAGAPEGATGGSEDVIPTVGKYPATGSAEWNALSPEQKKAASDDFYGMDPALKEFFEPAPGLSYDPPIGMTVWRKNAATGKLQRVHFIFGTGFFVPGERIYVFLKLSPDAPYSMHSECRLGFGFQTCAATVLDPASGKAQLPPYYTFQEAQNVKLDGQPCHLWDNNASIYGETSDQLIPAPKTSEPRMGHKVIDESFAEGAFHYVSLEYDIPEMVWEGAFSYGSGSTGSGYGSIGAEASHFYIEPLAGIDVRYVLDDDYRAAMDIDQPEAEQPIPPREKLDRYSLIEALEAKQIAEKSPLYSEEYGRYLFPTTDTIKVYDANGKVVDLDGSYFLCSARAWNYFDAPKPTYKSLIKEIKGYEYVADDFERNATEYYNDGVESKLPKFSVHYDASTGLVRYVKHFYVTYKKVPEPPTPPEPPRTPTIPPTGDGAWGFAFVAFAGAASAPVVALRLRRRSSRQ